MLRYLLYRLLWLFPTMILITMATFFLSSRGEENRLLSFCTSLADIQTSPQQYLECARRERATRGYDQPLFLFSIHPLSQPGDLYLIDHPDERKAIDRLCWELGCTDAVLAFRDSAFRLLEQQALLPTPEPGLRFVAQDLRQAMVALLREGDPASVTYQLDRIDSLSGHFPTLAPAVFALRNQWNRAAGNPARWRTFVPCLTWHGLQNQYLDWLAALVFRFDGGTSMENIRVFDSIRPLLPVTMLFTGLGILLALAISLPLAIWAARHAGSRAERGLGVGLLALDAVPGFWMALMLLIYLADVESSGYFPSTWLPDAPFPKRLHSMVLPLFAYTYGSLAFLTRTLRASLLEIAREPFLLTAKAKGYSPSRLLWNHQLRPALLPVFTVLGALLPSLIGGSVVLENLFDINGIGQKILDGVMRNEQNLVLAVFTLSGLLTVLGYFLSDLLVAWADPRIRLRQQNSSQP